MTENKVLPRSSHAIIALALGGILVMSRFIEPSSLPRMCIFRILTGMPCMFCGLTHAFHALSLGNLEAAIKYHPLVLPAYGLVVLYFALSCLSVFGWKYPRSIPVFGTSALKISFVVFTFFWVFRIMNAPF